MTLQVCLAKDDLTSLWKVYMPQLDQGHKESCKQVRSILLLLSIFISFYIIWLHQVLVVARRI